MQNGAYKLKLKWTKRALQQLENAQDYIAQDNPTAANEVAARIAEAVYLLLTQPKMGRKGRVAGTFEWIVKQTPYLIVYVIENDTLQILRVIHSKQNWPYSLH